jgi:SAM-dependent methyltransferase
MKWSIHVRFAASACLFLGLTLSLAAGGEVPAANGAEHGQALSAERLLGLADIDGGLVVHIGDGEVEQWGRFTAQLGADKRYLVHGLYAGGKGLERARELIRAAGRYGRVSADRFDGERLPYADGIVNLVIVSGGVAGDVREKRFESGVSSRGLFGRLIAHGRLARELERVLAPGGMALIQTDQGWRKVQKPWPKDIDDWTHAAYEASGRVA